MPQQPDEPVNMQSTPKGVNIAGALARLEDALQRSAIRRGTTASAANRRQIEALGALGIAVGVSEDEDGGRSAPGKMIGGGHGTSVHAMEARRPMLALAYAAPCGDAG